MSKIQTVLNNPKALFYGLGSRGYLRSLPDKLYLKMMYYLKMGKKLDLKNPLTFNEKLQWLKLYDRKSEYTKLVDKYEVRKYISDNIGEKYLIPMIAVYDSIDEIQWDKLPDQFVLKCTHGSHSNIICSDKDKLDIDVAKMKLNKWMKMNWFWLGREWPYKNVKPRIIAEQFMKDDKEPDLKDYKFMCFNGEVKCCFVCAERDEQAKAKIIVYDKNWELMEIGRDQVYHTAVPKPHTYDKMLELATKLSKDIPFARIDFYEINGQLYFGEITFFPAMGMTRFTPESADELLGSWIDLSKIKEH